MPGAILCGEERVVGTGWAAGPPARDGPGTFGRREFTWPPWEQEGSRGRGFLLLPPRSAFSAAAAQNFDQKPNPRLRGDWVLC